MDQTSERGSRERGESALSGGQLLRDLDFHSPLAPSIASVPGDAEPSGLLVPLLLLLVLLPMAMLPLPTPPVFLAWWKSSVETGLHSSPLPGRGDREDEVRSEPASLPAEAASSGRLRLLLLLAVRVSEVAAPVALLLSGEEEAGSSTCRGVTRRPPAVAAGITVEAVVGLAVAEVAPVTGLLAGLPC